MSEMGVCEAVCVLAPRNYQKGVWEGQNMREEQREGVRDTECLYKAAVHASHEQDYTTLWLPHLSVCKRTEQWVSDSSQTSSVREGYNGENVDKRAWVQVWQSSAALDPLLCIIVFNLALWANLLSRTGIPEYDRQKVFTPTEQAVKALCGFQRAVKWKAGFLPGQFQIMRDLEKMSNSIQGIPIILWLLKVYKSNMALS